jgi:hypothetical protein
MYEVNSFYKTGWIRNTIGIVILLYVLNFHVFFWFVPAHSVSDIPGIRIPYNPIQKRTDKEPWVAKGAKFTPLRSYDITGIVLATEKYGEGTDPFGHVSKNDIFLGWQQMSNPLVINDYAFRPGVRMMKGQEITDNPHISSKELIHYTSNNHLIAANRTVQKILDDARERDTLRLVGYLVKAKLNGHEKSKPWKSSLSRTDETTVLGGTSCEIMWVDYAEITYPNGDAYNSDERYYSR